MNAAASGGRDRPGKLREWMWDCQHSIRRVRMLDDTGQFTLLWWQWWLLAMVTLNTALNTVVFFKHRFKGFNKTEKENRNGNATN